MAMPQHILIIISFGFFKSNVTLQLYSAWQFSNFHLMLKTVSGGTYWHPVFTDEVQGGYVA